MSLSWMVFDDTELQMLYEAIHRVRPFAEMNADMAEIQAKLESRLQRAIQRPSGDALLSEGSLTTKSYPREDDK